MTKLGLVGNVNVESRMLAVDLVELLHKWEKCRQDHVRSQQASKEGGAAADVCCDGGRRGHCWCCCKRALDAPEEASAVKKVRIDESGIAASTTASKSSSPAPGRGLYCSTPQARLPQTRI